MTMQSTRHINASLFGLGGRAGGIGGRAGGDREVPRCLGNNRDWPWKFSNKMLLAAHHNLERTCIQLYASLFSLVKKKFRRASMFSVQHLGPAYM